MAQAAAMGPPLSPRETRRSGRRSHPSASTSASKSPDSDPAPKQKESSSRPPLTSNNSNGRQKRLKQEEIEDTVEDRKNAPLTSSTSSAPAGATGRTKRKTKDKDKDKALAEAASGEALDFSQAATQDIPEEEEQGITRCVCGSTGEDDPDAGEFMVQCETCKVWQHGLCMGFESEDLLHDDDYYCEECKPELHPDLFNQSRKRAKRPRQSSTNSHHNPVSVSRLSRSHSPSTLLKQPSKRRNTMNSRDAAFDESLKEIIEATAAEAAAALDNASVTSEGIHEGQQSIDGDVDHSANGRKKRKRTEDDAIPNKRTRSASTASEHPGSARGSTPGQNKVAAQVTSVPLKPARFKRGGRKALPTALTVDTVGAVDNEEGAPPSTTKRQGNTGRVKTSYGPKRPPVSYSYSGAEHTSRRMQASGGTSGQTANLSINESSRAYRNTHAYVVSQQPLYTSWNLPDYLAHLEPMLPTESPQPLEVRGSAAPIAGLGRGDSIDRMVERGVKVKWPSKRMSVGDMNKRVRALVEWVGREQATAQDRTRRKEALTKAFQEESKNLGNEGELGTTIVDEAETEVYSDTSRPPVQFDDAQSSATMKIMEELMEELIRFQERFGPGARNRERDRRLVSS